jgi:hypothetical protein
MKLEKAGEVVSDAAKLTRLIHPNQGSGSMYDKLAQHTNFFKLLYISCLH